MLGAGSGAPRERGGATAHALMLGAGSGAPRERGKARVRALPADPVASTAGSGRGRALRWRGLLSG